MILTHPVLITSRLLPGLRIGDGHGHGWLAVAPAAGTGDYAGHIVWTVHVDAPAGWDGGAAAAIAYRADGSDGITTGAQYRADGDGARAALSALCSFLSAAAESRAYAYGDGDGDGDLFPADVTAWAHHFSDEIAMTGEELDGDGDGGERD